LEKTKSESDNDPKTVTNVNSVESCQFSCRNTDECEYWSFKDIDSEKKCWHLKNKNNVEEGKSPGYTLGAKYCNPKLKKVEDATDCEREMTGGWAHNHLKKDSTITTKKACQKDCKDNKDCKFWNFNTKKNDCYLLSDADYLAIGALPGFTIGKKDCEPKL